MFTQLTPSQEILPFFPKPAWQMKQTIEKKTNNDAMHSVSKAFISLVFPAQGLNVEYVFYYI